MISIIFLGTGPVGGIKKSSKDRRRESSLLLRIGEDDFLFDVTRDFDWQNRFIRNLKGIFITHGHRDAIGGMAKLKNWWRRKKLKNPIPLWSHSKTITHIKKKFQDTACYLDFNKTKPEEKIKIGDLKVLPILVPHSIQPNFPTFAFKINVNKKKIIYASDIGKISPHFKNIIDKIDVLIIDGAMWNKKIKSHLEVKKSLPVICKTGVRKIYLTQIGRTTPPHRLFKTEVKKICSKAEPAYDGLRIILSAEKRN